MENALKKYYDDVIRVQSAARAFFARKSKPPPRASFLKVHLSDDLCRTPHPPFFPTLSAQFSSAGWSARACLRKRGLRPKNARQRSSAARTKRDWPASDSRRQSAPVGRREWGGFPFASLSAELP